MGGGNLNRTSHFFTIRVIRVFKRVALTSLFETTFRTELHEPASDLTMDKAELSKKVNYETFMKGEEVQHVLKIK